MIEHGPERIDVSATIEFLLIQCLLRGNVVRGAEHGFVIGTHGVETLYPGKAKIGQFDGAVTVDNHVVGLDVTMDHLVVFPAVVECFRELGTDGESVFFVDRVSQFEQVRDGTAGNMLHDNVALAVVLAKVDDLDNVWVADSRCRLSFDSKAFPFFLCVGRVVVKVVFQNFHGNDPILPGLPSHVDVSHSALTDFFDDFVAGNIRFFVVLAHAWSFHAQNR